MKILVNYSHYSYRIPSYLQHLLQFHAALYTISQIDVAENGKYTSCVVSKSLRICRNPGICINGVPSARVHVITLPVSFKNITELGGSTRNSGPLFSFDFNGEGNDDDDDCDDKLFAIIKYPFTLMCKQSYYYYKEL
ncbi:hypothetical protein DERP_000421 [Dermatophagoides pteronyssinus]|uniref:Uncharacterized protein n=1 Tax=Dermatophagoides pteronyssinus TaxID=6956 RepID=A0ABQ8J031_DERPT|nr:hypothetical protein DERP_000421 [Dermatophagoides pteronyssinus]